MKYRNNIITNNMTLKGHTRRKIAVSDFTETKMTPNRSTCAASRGISRSTASSTHLTCLRAVLKYFVTGTISVKELESTGMLPGECPIGLQEIHTHGQCM